jgi:cytochrome oxidase Cu insertion factor (SCO1/SenC/PrrC family)
MPVNRKSLLCGLLLTMLSLSAAFASIAYSDKLNHYFTDFHGYSQRINLKLPEMQTTADDIHLILPAFNSCTDTCPANLMLSRDVLDGTQQAVRLVILSIQPEQDASTLLVRYATVTGQQPALLDKQHPASWSLLARSEQIRQSGDQQMQHAGHLYLYHPASRTLLTYPHPDAESIISDIKQLMTGTKHG